MNGIATSPRTVKPEPAKVQVWCDDWSKDWTTGNPHTFDMDECTRSVTPPWQCVPATVSGPSSVLDDGRARRYTWTDHKATGDPTRIKDIVITHSKVTVRAGTPSRAGTPEQEADTQPYEGVPSDDWHPQNPILDLQWFKAGVPGQPWRMDRVVSFTAQFSTPHVTIDKMDMDTGEVKEGVPTYTFELGTGTCPSAPISVNVYRAHNVR